MSLWDDFKDAFGIGGKAEPKRPTPFTGARDEHEWHPDAAALADEFSTTPQQAHMAISMHGSVAEARRQVFEPTPASNENAAREASRSMGIDIHTAREVVEARNAMWNMSDEFMRARYGDQMTPNDGVAPEFFMKRLQLQNIAYHDMRPRKPESLYPDLSVEDNADINREARKVAFRTQVMSDEALKARYAKIPESAEPISQVPWSRQDWITHMHSQELYSRLTGRPAPRGIPVLPREPDAFRSTFDETAGRQVEAHVARMAVLSDAEVRKSFSHLHDAENINLAPGGAARRYQIRSLISEHVGRQTSQNLPPSLPTLPSQSAAPGVDAASAPAGKAGGIVFGAAARFLAAKARDQDQGRGM